jgi:hydroxymethylbilane synthase
VADQLMRLHPGLRVELRIYRTSGDQIADRPLHELGGKGLFTKELQRALLDRQIDFAVHSYKDVPVTMPLVDASGLVMAAVPPRLDPRDVLVCSQARCIDDLPAQAKVGTGSLRRRCQLLARRSDLRVSMVRGNIDTRLRKLRQGEFDAVILAMAGLQRAHLFDAQTMAPIATELMLPSAGQAALALECRKEDQRTQQLLASLHDLVTAQCVELERAVVEALGGDCHSPIAVLATKDQDDLHLRCVVGARDGQPPLVGAEARSPWNTPREALDDVVQQLRRGGAAELLRGP